VALHSRFCRTSGRMPSSRGPRSIVQSRIWKRRSRVTATAPFGTDRARGEGITAGRRDNVLVERGFPWFFSADIFFQPRRSGPVRLVAGAHGELDRRTGRTRKLASRTCVCTRSTCRRQEEKPGNTQQNRGSIGTAFRSGVVGPRAVTFIWCILCRYHRHNRPSGTPACRMSR
jgi:hypothetical protein